MKSARRGQRMLHCCLAMSIWMLLALTATPVLAAEGAAAGVLAGWRGVVSVEREGKSIVTDLGMRLLPGDVVVTGPGARATIYFSGGRVEELDASTRLVLPKSQPSATAQARDAMRFGSSNVQMLESGLGVLNDPNGSVLLAMASRGVSDEPTRELRAELLSPRNEVIDGQALTFYARSGPRPVRIAIYDGRKLIHRSDPMEGAGPWRITIASPLDAARVYRWVLTTGDNDEPASDSASFRISPAEQVAQSAQLEQSLTKLEPDAADLMRCAHYAQAGHWTAVLAASHRLLATHPDATLALRARDASRRALGLNDAAAVALEALLVP